MLISLNEDLLLHVLLLADIETIVAAKAACIRLRRLGRITLTSVPWQECASNRGDLRRRLWQGADLQPVAPRVVSVHNGRVWSVAMNRHYIVSAADGSPILQIADASCTKTTCDATFNRLTCQGGKEIEGVKIDRPVASWHIALHEHQLAVLGRLIDLDQLHLWPVESFGALRYVAYHCPLTSSLVTWADSTDGGHLCFTQQLQLRAAGPSLGGPATMQEADEDHAAMIRCDLASGSRSLLCHPNAIAAGTGEGTNLATVLNTPLRFIAVTTHAGAVHGRHQNISVWFEQNPAPVVLVTSHRRPIYALAAGAGRLASGSDDGRIKLWNPFDSDQAHQPASQLLASIETGSKVWALAISGDLMVSGGAGNAVSNINVWCLRGVPGFAEACRIPWEQRPTRLRAPVRLASLRGADSSPNRGIRSLAFDGDRVVAGADDGHVYVWHHPGLPLA